MLPAVIVNNQELRVMYEHIMIHFGDVLPGFFITSNVLGSPVFIIQTPHHYGRMCFNECEHSNQFFPVVISASLIWLVCAGNFHPKHKTNFVGQFVYTWINTSNMDADYVTPQFFHGIHVAFNFFISSRSWLIKNAIQINRIFVQVNETSTWFYFSKTEMRFDFRNIALGINQLRNQMIQVGCFGGP